MKLLITIILLLSPILTNGQIFTNNKISFSLFFKPGYSYRFLNKNSTAYNNAIPRFSYQFGVNINYAFTERFEILTGCYMSHYSLKNNLDLTSYNFDNMYDPIIDSIPINENPYKLISWSNYNFIDIPLNIRYYFLTKNIKLYLQTGLLLKRLIHIDYKTLFFYNNQTDEQKGSSTMNKGMLAYNIGFGMDFKLNDKYSIL